MIVSEVPGTTRDAIDTMLERDGRTYLLVDTAGLRRKRRQRQGIEYYSELRAIQAAERADVALVLIDSSEGIVDQDLAVADVARKAGCSTLVVLAKWDITTVTIEDVRPRSRRGCASGRRSSPSPRRPAAGSTALLEQGRRAVREAHRPDPDAGAEPSSTNCARRGSRRPRRGRRLNLLYGAQVATRPPRFRFSVNEPAS